MLTKLERERKRELNYEYLEIIFYFKFLDFINKLNLSQVRKDPRFRLSVSEGSSVLYIEGVTREDSGEYICEVSYREHQLLWGVHLRGQ